MHALTFADLRRGNKARLPLFKNGKGEIVHNADGSDWKLGQWGNALAGEVGEAANIIKKIERGDKTLEEARQDLADELADVMAYLDILAFRAGIDLGQAVADKWNRVSERIGCAVRIGGGSPPRPPQGKGMPAEELKEEILSAAKQAAKEAIDAFLNTSLPAVSDILGGITKKDGPHSGPSPFRR